MSEALETLEAGAVEEARAAVIWLHGLGADGHDFEPIVPELGLPQGHGVRFVFPHAPVRPVTINGGVAMRAWYDIYGIGAGYPEDDAGIRAGAAAVEALIAREQERGVPPERVVLAGFSQGGAVALHTGLRHSRRLAGIMALSTYLPLRETCAEELSEANRGLPVFMAHGTYDPVLPYSLGDRSRELLEGIGYPVEWHSYPMEHQVCLEEVRAIGAWLTRVLGLSA